jgi:translation initiation factor 2B subunit (eIF-2B alpha/beta/delta family)
MFEDIARDNRSGASALTRAAAARLAEVAAASRAKDPGAFWDELMVACRALVAAHREMASVVRLAGRVLSAAERAVLSGLPPEAARDAVRVECERSVERADAALAALALHGARLVAPGAVAATLSASSAVAAVLEAAAARGTAPSVILSESRPALEGVAMARRLGEAGIAATVTTDAALPGAVSRAALVLVGADSVSESEFVNKTGTYALALAAREAAVPVFVAAPLDRFIPASLRGEPGRLRDGREVLASPPPGVSVENPYFEAVPLSLAAGIVTEEGVKPPAEAAAIVARNPVPPALLSILFPPRAA